MPDNNTLWNQVNVMFPDWDRAEYTAAALIATQLDAHSAWFFIRKHPCWRIRYQLADPETHDHVEQYLDSLVVAGHITCWSLGVYEPEVHAFGGPESMAAVHRLFHADSNGILGYLHDHPESVHRREISLLLCSVMMRAAAQDLYEQGDVWARVAAHRGPPPGMPPGEGSLVTSLRRLITVDAGPLMREGGPLAHCAGWAGAYAAAGHELASLAAAGRLHRGLRDILAHHVIFAWNRAGLPYETQSALASAAKTAVFGPDPATSGAG